MKYFVTLKGTNPHTMLEVSDVECILGARNEHEARLDALELWKDYKFVEILHIKAESDVPPIGSAAWCETQSDNTF